jgi:hypothetical protein
MSTAPRRFKRKLLVSASILAAILIVGVIVLTYVPLGNDPHIPGVGPASFEVQRASIEANNQLNSSSTSTHGTHAQFPARRIAVVNESDHLIMKRVVDHVADHLRSLPFTETVDVIDSFQAIAPGSELYDQYITLSAPDLTIKGMLITGQDVDATIKVSMSPTLFTSRTSYSTSQDLATLKLSYEATLSHSSTTTGYESANAKHKTVANNIAQELSTSLGKALNESVIKAGARPVLPVSFVADYEPVPKQLAQSLANDWEQLISGHGHMTPNTTIWTRTTMDRDAALNELTKQLIDAGFTGKIEPKIDYSHWHLRYNLGEGKVLDVFESREGYGQPIEGVSAKLIIRYRQRMAKAKVTELIDELIANHPEVSFEDLLPLLNMMTPTQQEALAKRMMDVPPTRIPAALAAARLLHDTGRSEQAMDILDRVALLFEFDDEGVSKNTIKKLGQEITGDPEWDIPKPTAAQLATAGFVRLTAGTPIEADVALNESVFGYIYTDESKGEFMMIAARVLPSAIPEGVYTLQVSNAGNNEMGNTRSTSTTHHPQRPWHDQNSHGFNNLRFEVDAKETGDQTFRITVTVTKAQSP